MLEAQAEVAKVVGETVSLKLNSPNCGGCNASCSSANLSRVDGIHLKSSEKLDPGESIVIGLTSRQFLVLSVLFYLSPLLGLFIGMLVGDWITEQFAPESTEMGALVGGVLGLFLAFSRLSSHCSGSALSSHMLTITPLR